MLARLSRKRRLQSDSRTIRWVSGLECDLEEPIPGFPEVRIPWHHVNLIAQGVGGESRDT